MQIDDLRKGSKEAFQELVEQYKDKVVRTCYSFINNLDDAEDVAQEVFIEIYKSILKFRNESDINTWIYRISVNKSLDFVRKRKRKKRIANLRELFTIKNKYQANPHQKLEENEHKEILYDQIHLLAENQKIALILSQYDRLSNKKIAEVLGTSESAVESLLHRARTNLRKNLEKYFENNL